MTNRRVFLGGALAIAAAGWAGIARRIPSAPGPIEMVPFYALGAGSSLPGDNGVVLGRIDDVAAAPIDVELGSVEVGHFHGLMHEGGGRIACLYEATIPGPNPRKGLVRLDPGRGLGLA